MVSCRVRGHQPTTAALAAQASLRQADATRQAQGGSLGNGSCVISHCPNSRRGAQNTISPRTRNGDEPTGIGRALPGQAEWHEVAGADLVVVADLADHLLEGVRR